MTTNPIRTIALLSTIIACDNTLPFDPDRFDETAKATFGEAGSDALWSAVLISGGWDIQGDLGHQLWPLMREGLACVTVSEVPEGVQYQGAGSPGCGNRPFLGTISVVGAEGLDWRQDYPQMDILLDLDQVEFTALWPDGEQSKYSADGTITSQLSFFGGGDFATALEADISHTLRSGARVESHVRMDQGKDGHAPLRHGPNSWAAVDGLGSFEIFGTVDAGGGLADLVLTGIDTLTFSRFEGAKGWESCMKVDGEVVDGNCAD